MVVFLFIPVIFIIIGSLILFMTIFCENAFLRWIGRTRRANPVWTAGNMSVVEQLWAKAQLKLQNGEPVDIESPAEFYYLPEYSRWNYRFAIILGSIFVVIGGIVFGAFLLTFVAAEP